MPAPKMGRAIDYAHVAAYYHEGEDVQFTDEDRSLVSATPRPDRERLNTFENEVYGLAAEARSGFGDERFRTTLAFGGDICWTRQEGLRDGTEPPFGEVFPSRAFPATDFMLGGLFIASDFAFCDGAVTIFPALRYDFYDLDPTDDPLLPTFAGAEQGDSRLSPKVGVTVKLGDDVVLYGNYAQGFRAPTPYQVNNFFENLAFGYLASQSRSRAGTQRKLGRRYPLYERCRVPTDRRLHRRLRRIHQPASGWRFVHSDQSCAISVRQFRRG